MFTTRKLFFVFATITTAMVVYMIGFQYRETVTEMQKMDVKRCCITVNNIGRTGNQLYQLFALVGIASTLNCTPYLQENMSRKVGRLIDVSAVKTIDAKNNYSWTSFTEKSSLRYDPRVKTLDQAFNWKLQGYFQSWRYFKMIEGYIRKEFKFKQHLVIKAKLYFKNYTCGDESDNCLNIAIHVRRGDILSAFLLQYGYVDVSVSYLYKSINYFRKRFSKQQLHFVVASDDIQWCKTNIKGANVHFSTMSSVEEDLVLLSSCDHAIITVGSFGRIVGFFTGGDVIYYRDFPRPGSQMFNKTNMTDIYPDHWVGLK